MLFKQNIILLKKDLSRNSRGELTRELIRKNGLSGRLNNTKWHEILEWIDESRLSFDIKLLSELNFRYCDFIRELEKTSVLLDESGDFIEFLEIEFLKLEKNENVVNHLEILGKDHIEEIEWVIIQGYRV